MELLGFLEGREKLTAAKITDRQSATEQKIDDITVASCCGGAVPKRTASSGSLLDAVTVHDFTILKVLGQVIDLT